MIQYIICHKKKYIDNVLEPRISFSMLHLSKLQLDIIFFDSTMFKMYFEFHKTVRSFFLKKIQRNI